MAWYVNGNNLQMAEGDYGIALPVTITGVTFVAADSVKLTFKDRMNGNTILTKDFTNISQNTVSLELTAAESALLPVGSYVYSLDWHQNGAFMCNIIPCATLKVVDKA